MNNSPYAGARPAWLSAALQRDAAVPGEVERKKQMPAKRGKQIRDPNPAGKPGEF